ncbi:MAG: hypothetical protein V4683_15155, partial [Bacteroidota bacterium]
MMANLLIYGRQFILVLFSFYAFAQKPDSLKTKKDNPKPNFGTLFKSNDTLQFSITAHMKPLLRDRGEKPIYHLGQVQFKTTKSKNIQLPIKIRVRGNFRKSTQNCAFPPLLLNFDKKNDGNSVFNRQNRLKLVTHCIKRDNIIKEQLVYRIYNLLTDYSFKSRLTKVTYIDSAAKRPSETRLAFLIEDETILAKRIGTKPYTKVRLRQNQLDTLTMATISIFEFMIGNTDWSVPYLHNIKVFYKEAALPIPVPYDFDHSGIVNATYAYPAEELNIASVKERLYRGIYYSRPILDRVFAKFREVKPQVYALYEGNPGLDKSYIKYVTDYLDDFYEIIDNEKSIKN